MRFEDREAAVQQQLDSLLPGLDTSPLSIVGTLNSAYAEMGAQADALTDATFDWNLDDLSGTALNNMANLFGFTRLAGNFATGYVVLRFGIPVSRDYVLDVGTPVFSRIGNRQRNYMTTTRAAISQGVTAVTIPIVAAQPGPGYNAAAGEVNVLPMTIEQLVRVTNETPVSGGTTSETDAEFRYRIRQNLFRNVLGTIDYYQSVGLKHAGVSAVQLITPAQDTEEYLQVVNREAHAQNDSVKYTYTQNPAVKLNKNSANTDGGWLQLGSDYTFITDNETPNAPVFRFSNPSVLDGDIVTVRYRYTSTKSRNDPDNNVIGKLDLYVEGTQPFPAIDHSIWLPENTVGNGAVTTTTHPDAPNGQPYYVFVRQPVLSLSDDLVINGVTYALGTDYVLANDKTLNDGSTRARDIIVWLTTLPPGVPNPAFDISYLQESVVADIQNALDLPTGHMASDDIIAHTADELKINVDVVVEWTRGIDSSADLTERLQTYLSQVIMGTDVEIGQMLYYGMQSSRIIALTLGNNAVIANGKRYTHRVPLPDGTVPVLNSLNITTVAENTYSG